MNADDAHVMWGILANVVSKQEPDEIFFFWGGCAVTADVYGESYRASGVGIGW